MVESGYLPLSTGIRSGAPFSFENLVFQHIFGEILDHISGRNPAEYQEIGPWVPPGPPWDPPHPKETQVQRHAERRDRAQHTQNTQDTQQEHNPTHRDAETTHKHDNTKGAGAEGARPLCEGRPKAALHVCVLFLHLRVWDCVFVVRLVCFVCVVLCLCAPRVSGPVFLWSGVGFPFFGDEIQFLATRS